jgi:hypothetical protein
MSKFLVICDGAVYQTFSVLLLFFCFALSFYKLDNTGGARPFKILNVSSAIVLILLICCVGIFALISKFS